MKNTCPGATATRPCGRTDGVIRCGLSALILLAVSGCQRTPTAPEGLRYLQPSNTWVYQCGTEYQFVIRFADSGEHAWLFLPDHTLKLQRSVSASGARYGAGDTEFWGKNTEAKLTVGGQPGRQCLRLPAASIREQAKLDGYSFRALGNEPDWLLLIRTGESFTLVTELGKRVRIMPWGAPRELAGKQASVFDTEFDGHRASIILQVGPCRDSMADQVYPTTVDIDLGDVQYHGCGMPLF